MSDFISQDDLDAVRELLQFVTNNGLGEISVTLETGASIKIVSHSSVAPIPAAPVIYTAAPAPTPLAGVQQSAAPQPVSTPMPEEASAPIAAALNRIALASPMVGIYYASPSPGEPAFVMPGDRIKVGQTIGLIEAMKVFSEIPSDVAGRVVETAAANGDLVQLGQPLLYVEPG